MVLPAVKEQILEDLEQMSPGLQQEAAERVHDLVSMARGASAEDLRGLAGILDTESADEMRAAIEDGCRQIDADAW